MGFLQSQQSVPLTVCQEAELLGLKVSAALASAKARLSKDTDDITTKRKDHYFLAMT